MEKKASHFIHTSFLYLVAMVINDGSRYSLTVVKLDPFDRYIVFFFFYRTCQVFHTLSRRITTVQTVNLCKNMIVFSGIRWVAYTPKKLSRMTGVNSSDELQPEEQEELYLRPFNEF